MFLKESPPEFPGNYADLNQGINSMSYLFICLFNTFIWLPISYA